MLEVDQLVKHYRTAGEEVRAIDGVSLHVRAGEMVALRGPSGSGKTTLLLLIAGLLSADAGAIRFAGREITAQSEDRTAEYLMREVGFIYQTVQLMPRTSVLENAALKLLLGGMSMRAAKNQTLPWLVRLGLEDRLGYTPEQLSGGERQRVAIARALSGKPKLILADEPTGNLDSARSREITTLLSEIARERDACVVLVTHDSEVAEAAHRQYMLRDGKLTGHGPLQQQPQTQVQPAAKAARG